MDDSNEFKAKLQELYNNRGITKTLRTHLRQLILSELQNSNVEKKFPPISIKSRAIGALIVEWLYLHGCHYTLSVLASEIPSLSDLPMLSNEGSQKKLQKEEVEDVLLAIGLRSSEILNEYELSECSLIAVILKATSAWKERLNFKDLPLSPRYSNKKDPKWAERLKDIVADSFTDSEKLPLIYSSLYSFVKSEVDERLSQERKHLFDELLLRENSIKAKLKDQESQILFKLKNVKEGIHQTKEMAEEEFHQRKALLSKLMEEVQKQHQAVLNGLSELKVREEKLDSDKMVWQKLKEKEGIKLQEKANLLKKKEEELKTMAASWAGEQNKAKTTDHQSTTVVLPLSEADNVMKKGETQQPLGKQKNIAENLGEGYGKDYLPLSSSESSSLTLVSSDGAKNLTLRRIKELRDETKRNVDDFQEQRLVVDSDSSSSDEEDSPNMLRLHRKDRRSSSQSRSQITLPFLREGCHSLSSQVFASTSRNTSKRHQSQGDRSEVETVKHSNLPRKVKLAFPVTNNSEAVTKLREQVKVLDNLIQASRKNNVVDRFVKGNYDRQKINREYKKIRSLVEGVRSPSPETKNLQEKSPQYNSHAKTKDCAVITEETNMVGAGESYEERLMRSRNIQHSSYNKTLEDKNIGSYDIIDSPKSPIGKQSHIEETLITFDVGVVTSSPTPKKIVPEIKKMPNGLDVGDIISPIFPPIVEPNIQETLKPGLLQTTLLDDSEPDGEIVSVGNRSNTSDKFWS